MKPKSYLWRETKYMPTFLITSSVSAVLAAHAWEISALQVPYHWTYGEQERRKAQFSAIAQMSSQVWRLDKDESPFCRNAGQHWGFSLPPSLSFDSSLPSYKLLQTHQRVTLLHRQYHMHFSNFKFYTVAKSTRLQSFSTAHTLFITLQAIHSTCVNCWHARITVGRSANLRLAVHIRRKREAILAVLEVHHAHVVNGLQVCFQVAWPVEKLATNITLKSAIEGLVHQHVAPHAVLGWVRLEADRARVVGPSCRQERRALSRRWRLQLLEVRVVLAEKVVHTWHLIIGSDCATTWGLLVGSRKRRKKGNMEEAIYLHHFRKRRERSIFTEPSVCA